MNPRNQARPRQKKQAPRDRAQEPTGDLMTPVQVARYFGVKVRRVRGWERRRFLTPVITPRGERVYMTCEVEHLAAMYGR